MPRFPRYAAVGVPHHVIQRGNNRCPTFINSSDYQFFRTCLDVATRRHGCAVHAYVLMTNHVHLLMTPAASGAIGKVMQSVGRRYVQWFNNAHGRTGTLWEGRYRATVIDTEQYLFACYRYIELNPVRAGLVHRAWDYQWSSHRANMSGGHDSLVTPHQRYVALGADEFTRRREYGALFGEAVDESTLQHIRDRTNRGWALGGDQFCETLAASATRPVRPRRRGRPRSTQG